jgi:hypothetical protein
VNFDPFGGTRVPRRGQYSRAADKGHHRRSSCGDTPPLAAVADDLAPCSAAGGQSGEPAPTRTRDLLHITKQGERDAGVVLSPPTVPADYALAGSCPGGKRKTFRTFCSVRWWLFPV